MVDPTLSPSGANDLQRLATVILQAVEQQLNRYFTAASARIDGVEQQLRLQAAAPPPPGRNGGLDAETMLEVRQALRDDLQHVLTEVQNRMQQLRTADAQLVEQINTLGMRVVATADALSQRIDTGDQQAGQRVEARLDTLQRAVGATVEEVLGRVDDRSTLLLSKIEAVDSGATDRVLALEQRLKDDLGRKIAELEAGFGRAASGFDEAMVTLAQRISEIDSRVIGLEETMQSVAASVARVDASAIEAVRHEAFTARNDVEIIRAHMAHAEAGLNEQVATTARRMQQMEVEFAAAMDVSAAVQLERLDEIERQVLMLGPPGHRALGSTPPPPPTMTTPDVASAPAATTDWSTY
jgi:hypothetical protein